MDLGEVPAEGWRVYLEQEQRRLLAARYQCPGPPTLTEAPVDSAAYLDYLMSQPTEEVVPSQMQIDWDTFVTFARTPSPERSPTPSPLLPAQSLRMGWPLTRTSSLDAGPMRRPRQAHPRSGTNRMGVRRNLRSRLRQGSLAACSQGRAILQLSSRAWYRTPSGFVVTQFREDESVWRANDLANYLSWLCVNIRVHRSTTHQLLCVENLGALNAVLAENNVAPIAPCPTPLDYLSRWGAHPTTLRGLPTFLRAGYSRRLQLGSYVNAAPPLVPMPELRLVHDAYAGHRASSPSPETVAQDAGQAARDGSGPRGASPQAPAQGRQQDGDRLLHGEHAERAGEDADAARGRDDGPVALADTLQGIFKRESNS